MKGNRGEIATILTLISVGLMLAGIVVGNVAVKQTTRTQSKAGDRSECSDYDGKQNDCELSTQPKCSFMKTGVSGVPCNKCVLPGTLPQNVCPSQNSNPPQNQITCNAPNYCLTDGGDCTGKMLGNCADTSGKTGYCCEPGCSNFFCKNGNKLSGSGKASGVIFYPTEDCTGTPMNNGESLSYCEKSAPPPAVTAEGTICEDSSGSQGKCSSAGCDALVSDTCGMKLNCCPDNSKTSNACEDFTKQSGDKQADCTNAKSISCADGNTWYECIPDKTCPYDNRVGIGYPYRCFNGNTAYNMNTAAECTWACPAPGQPIPTQDTRCLSNKTQMANGTIINGCKKMQCAPDPTRENKTYWIKIEEACQNGAVYEKPGAFTNFTCSLQSGYEVFTDNCNATNQAGITPTLAPDNRVRADSPATNPNYTIPACYKQGGFCANNNDACPKYAEKLYNLPNPNKYKMVSATDDKGCKDIGYQQVVGHIPGSKDILSVCCAEDGKLGGSSIIPIGTGNNSSASQTSPTACGLPIGNYNSGLSDSCVSCIATKNTWLMKDFNGQKALKDSITPKPACTALKDEEYAKQLAKYWCTEGRAIDNGEQNTASADNCWNDYINGSCKNSCSGVTRNPSTSNSPSNGDCAITIPAEQDAGKAFAVSVTTQKKATDINNYTDITNVGLVFQKDNTNLPPKKDATPNKQPTYTTWTFNNVSLSDPGSYKVFFQYDCTATACGGSGCGTSLITIKGTGTAVPAAPKCSGDVDNATDIRPACTNCIKSKIGESTLQTISECTTDNQKINKYCTKNIPTSIVQCSGFIAQCASDCSSSNITKVGSFLVPQSYDNESYNAVIEAIKLSRINAITASLYVLNATRVPGLQRQYCDPFQGQCDFGV